MASILAAGPQAAGQSSRAWCCLRNGHRSQEGLWWTSSWSTKLQAIAALSESTSTAPKVRQKTNQQLENRVDAQDGLIKVGEAQLRHIRCSRPPDSARVDKAVSLEQPRRNSGGANVGPTRCGLTSSSPNGNPNPARLRSSPTPSLLLCLTLVELLARSTLIIKWYIPQQNR
jgi:hypothetical protein